MFKTFGIHSSQEGQNDHCVCISKFGVHLFEEIPLQRAEQCKYLYIIMHNINSRELREISHRNCVRVTWNKDIHQLSIESQLLRKFNCLSKLEPNFQAINLHLIQWYKVTFAGEMVLPWLGSIHSSSVGPHFQRQRYCGYHGFIIGAKTSKNMYIPQTIVL